jgi:hypothetical protein
VKRIFTENVDATVLLSRGGGEKNLWEVEGERDRERERRGKGAVHIWKRMGRSTEGQGFKSRCVAVGEGNWG